MVVLSKMLLAVEKKLESEGIFLNFWIALSLVT